MKIKNKVRNITILLIAFVIFFTPTINNVSEVSASQRFSDVPTTHWAYSHIMNLNNKGVINGYRDGSFGHNDSLTRGQAATLIVKTANIKNAGKKADFSDVSKNNEFSSFIAALVDSGAVNGYRDGRFGPNDKITRGQIAAIIVRAFGIKPALRDDVYFWDTYNNEFSGYIDNLRGNKIINGYNDNFYGPNDPVTRAQFSVILSNAIRVSNKQRSQANELSAAVQAAENAMDTSELTIVELNPEDEEKVKNLRKLFDKVYSFNMKVNVTGEEKLIALENRVTTLKYEDRVLELVNEERVAAGVDPVTMNREVGKAAFVRSTELVESFSHTRPDGSRPYTALTDRNIHFWGAAENIAAGYDSPESVMTGWMKSPGHRQNILNPNHTELGIGAYIEEGTRYGLYWTQLFRH